MRIQIQCIKTYEIVQPATELISQNLLTGEQFSTGCSIPESRWTTLAGKILTVTKGEAKKMVKTGNWQLAS